MGCQTNTMGPCPKIPGYAKEKKAIISFFSANRGDGYRRCAYVMIDKDVAYASPSTVYRVLKEAGMLQKKADDTSRGKGFKQPLVPHEHWHTDISYVKIEHRFYFSVCWTVTAVTLFIGISERT